MYVFFRLFRINLLSRFKKAINFFDETSVSFRVWPTDLDVFLHMNNGRYLTLLDLARFDSLIQSRMMKVLRDHQCFPVVTAETIQFKKSLKLFDRFSIKTKLLGWDEKSFYIQHIFIRHQKVYAVAIIKGQIVKKSGGTITPNELLRFIGHKAPPPELPQWIVEWSHHQKAALIEVDNLESV
jgi:acyl-CoA thioesterase FadM